MAFFFDPERGGLYPYASDGEQLIARNKEVYDGAMPSGNAVAALVFSLLARLTGEKRWQEAAEKQLSYLAGAVSRYPAGHSFAMLALLEALWPTAELVCTGQRVPPGLLARLREAPLFALSVLVKMPENEVALAALAPFTRDYPIPAEGERFYLCRDGSCAAPVDDIAKLELS